VLLVVAGILFVIWIAGFAFFRAVVGGAIHIILLIAIIALVWHLVSEHSGPRGSPGAASATSGEHAVMSPSDVAVVQRQTRLKTERAEF